MRPQSLDPRYDWSLDKYIQFGLEITLTEALAAFFHMCMAIVTFFFVVCSIRTNVILWLVFVFIDLAFIMLMAVYWTLAEGMTGVSGKLQIVSKDIPLSIVLYHTYYTRSKWQDSLPVSDRLLERLFSPSVFSDGISSFI